MESREEPILFLEHSLENETFLLNPNLKKHGSSFLTDKSIYIRKTVPFSPEIAKLPTGLVYSPKTELHTPGHNPDSVQRHIENPLRTINIMKQLESTPGILGQGVEYVQDVPPIDLALVARVHGDEYLDITAAIWPESNQDPYKKYLNSYYNRHSFNAARIAAESTRLAVQRVLDNQWKNAYSLSRPPGHNAQKNDRINGFCFLNNVAIATEYALQFVNRVLILDWGVHHGESTQKAFYDDDRVLVLSIHRFDQGTFFPGMEGAPHKVGSGKGKGFNLNLALDVEEEEDLIEDSVYLFAFHRAILPIIRQFEPDLILISCGLDCLHGDPLGKISLTGDGKYSTIPIR